MGEVEEKDEPTYDLGNMQGLLRSGRYLMLGGTMAGLISLKLDEDDMLACLLALTRRDFFKSMASTEMPGTWQDVYRPTYEERNLYVKLMRNTNAETVVIQFKAR